MVYYLKVNRDVEYTLSNLRAWIEAIVNIRNSKIYVLSDNDSLDEKIKSQILPDFHGYNISFLRSDRETENLCSIARSVTIPHWFNCACSHLTTFFHSKLHGYDSFWNIDADDTFFCVSKERLAEILSKAEDYAESQGIGCFSLDMWTSRNHGLAWSFGVTYTSNHINWDEVMLNHCRDDELNCFMPGHTKNLDLYFTYLRDNLNELRISTFCVDNLRFVHYGNDMYRNPIGTGFFHWKDGMLRFPLLFYFFGSRSLGRFPITNETVVLDLDISDKESYSLMKSFNPIYDEEKEEYFRDVTSYKTPEGTDRVQSHRMYAGKNTKYVLFGCGLEGRAMLRYLGDERVRCFVDNNKNGSIVDGKQVISFDELKEMDFKTFTLLITPMRGYSSILRQLEENGIFNYHTMPFPG